MNVIINDDGSVYIKNNSHQGYYDQNGNLKFVIGSQDAPEKIAINHHQKEIGELNYKISVDTTELDKLEEQLTRIKQLMQDVGIKVNIKPEQSNNYFIAGSGQYFIKDAVIDGAKLKCCVSGDAVFSGEPSINKFERGMRVIAEDIMKQAEQTNTAIAKWKAAHQSWCYAVNRTWCSQK